MGPGRRAGGAGGHPRTGCAWHLGAAAAAAAAKATPRAREPAPKGTSEPAAQPHVAHGGSLSPPAPCPSSRLPHHAHHAHHAPQARQTRMRPGMVLGGGRGLVWRARLGVSASRRPGIPRRGGGATYLAGFQRCPRVAESPRAQRRRRGGAGARGRGGAGCGARGAGRRRGYRQVPPRAPGGMVASREHNLGTCIWARVLGIPVKSGPSISTWVRRAWPRAHVTRDT